MKRLHNNQGFTQWNARKQAGEADSTGFTIMELMIATTVFSIILLLALAGFLQIGQLFYKGVNITRTSDVTNQVISSIKGDLSIDKGSAAIDVNVENLTAGGGDVERRYFCTGQNRYIFILGRQVNSEDKDVGPTSGWYKFGIIKEKYASAGCQDPSVVAIDPDNATELLGDKMRLSELTIKPIGNTLYTLKVRIAYGIDEVLTLPADPKDIQCQSGRNYSTYCFIADARTTVRRGLD